VVSEERFVICYTGELPPERVRTVAAEYGVEFVPLALN
jgi:hypothetical protein